MLAFYLVLALVVVLLLNLWVQSTLARMPDLIIGPQRHPQTLRWHLLRWHGWQLALHKWLRSDDDRALHDHSGDNVSVILSLQGYNEIVRKCSYDGHKFFNSDTMHLRFPFIPYFRKAETPHRVILHSHRPVWTLWLRCPSRRAWGFHCPSGWRHWQEYTSTRDYSAPGSVSEVGPGCG